MCTIHRRVFGDMYDWAGQLRTVAIAKGTWFRLPQYIESAAAEVFLALHAERLLRRGIRRHHARGPDTDEKDARRTRQRTCLAGQVPV